jgi:hypothetical protein
METKKNYRKPEYEEIKIEACILSQGSPCECDVAHGGSDDSM